MTDEETAGELTELAADPLLAARADQLRDLAAAMTDRGAAERWCEIDVFAAFPPDTADRPAGRRAPTDRKTRRWVLRGIDVVLPVLVFVPIAITWFGLTQATGAYGEAIAASGTDIARRPFLELWQQGFGGRLAGWARFDSIAMMTLTGIGLLMVLTVTERILLRSAEERAEHEEQALRSRLRTALTSAALHLGQVRLSAPARFQEELTRTAEEFGRIGETVRSHQDDVLKSLEGTVERADAVTAALRDSAERVTGGTAAVGDLLRTVTAATGDLVQAVDRSVYAFDQVGEKTDEAVTLAGGRLGDTLTDATARLREAMDDAAATTGRAVQDSVTDLKARVGELVGAAADISAMVARADASLADAGERLAGAVTGSARSLEAAFGTTGQEVGAALGDWADTAGAHASRIELVSDTAGRTARLLETTHQALDALPQALSAGVAGIPDAVRTATGAELARISAAADALAAARDTATAEVAALRDAVARLQRAVERTAERAGEPAAGPAEPSR
ncbi:hypothetical protein [Actinomadura parmotrematis]|uniref:Methyl-accepting chemotaxis protein n=1 Tax=Actinomadura parmotrematis TaxID=2864039 RepID=A0ABS7FYK9_9ACTN|nr:hypothetical protein [Actinomadura parmotrematis]MBW8485534.1 hypothetical protein [Actinomadura parmotrematis]